MKKISTYSTLIKKDKSNPSNKLSESSAISFMVGILVISNEKKYKRKKTHLLKVNKLIIS